MRARRVYPRLISDSKKDVYISSFIRRFFVIQSCAESHARAREKFAINDGFLTLLFAAIDIALLLRAMNVNLAILRIVNPRNIFLTLSR